MAIDYKSSGVDVERGYQAVKLMKKYIHETYNKNVIGDIRSFGNLYALDDDPDGDVLVAGTDGVGTKLKYAFVLEKFDTIGIDCVAMCVNDVLCRGAKPLFFLDYIAISYLDSVKVASIVKGVTEGCKQSGSALIGGETAEMPGFYSEGEFDIAGFSVGIVNKKKVIDGSKIKLGDVLIGLGSSGIHSNGYSLTRQLFPPIKEELDKYDDRLGKTYGEALLTPTRIYVKPVLKLIDKFEIKGIAHITGGGIIEKLARIFPSGLTAEIDIKSYKLPEIFKMMQDRADLSDRKMYNTFNMGIGMVLAVEKAIADAVVTEAERLGEKAYIIGKVVEGDEIIL